MGLEKPTSGRILLDGHDIARQSRHDRHLRARAVQLMFQDSYASMDPRMRVGTILREPLAIARDGSRADQRRRIAAILGEVGLPASSVDRYPHEFSGGQRQRLGLARALIGGPSLIVADEPVSALDVSIQAQILNLMRDLQHEHGLTYLFISHDLSVVRYMADAIGVMYLGKLVETGPADAVYAAPGAPVHEGADRHRPGRRPRRRAGQGAPGRPRRAALGDRAAERVPVPHPLSPRPGPVRHRRAAAAPLHQRRAPGRVPLPAPRAGAGAGIGGRIGVALTARRGASLPPARIFDKNGISFRR